MSASPAPTPAPSLEVRVIEQTKVANQLIEESIAANEQLTEKLSAYQQDDQTAVKQAPELINKLASLQMADGSPLIEDRFRQQFVESLNSKAGCLYLIDQMAAAYENLQKTAGSKTASDKASPGAPSDQRAEDYGDAAAFGRLPQSGRVRM